jgi:hypothetical protein
VNGRGLRREINNVRSSGGKPIGNINASSHHAAPCGGIQDPLKDPKRRRAAGPGALPGAETTRL